ncbi:uncharacterized protein LOC108632663 isoform X2 [Ceratina calcarata]|uniref:Uncharacterized protein LOC108632663 isoform X2 n=1 Tax=Ceratina calcarata TaxID=156304 RepID=A0AAJ7NFJ6_9HYME|nr:uncharacterized protein LOC108632663 isoform X2 [Ceratina calcarata]
MSFVIESRTTNEINNKDREHFLSLEMKEDYSFKYIPESHFKHIVKNVQRQRRKEDEERIWASFVKEQELNNLRFEKNDVDRSLQSMKDLLQENMQDVDRELKRLEEDALPERTKGTRETQKCDDKNETIYTKVDSNENDCSKAIASTKNKHGKSTNANVSTRTMSRANDISTRKESEALKIVFRSEAKKSLSDSSFTEKRSYTNQLLRATNDFANNSDTDFSNYRDDDVIYVEPDPFTVQKLLSMQKKIVELLDEILFRLCRIPLPDGDNDLKRRQQQTLEFAIRFSRNYLYNLNRLVSSIEGHVKGVSSRIGLKQYHRNVAFHQDMIKQKLITAHQLLVQALTAYSKHIPNSIVEGHSTKLQDVLQIVRSLTNTCDKIEISTSYYCSGDTTAVPLGKTLQDKCDAILSRLKLNLEESNCKNVESTVNVTRIPSSTKGRSNRKNLSSRLSMYSMDIKLSKNNQKRRNDSKRKSCVRQKDTGSNVKDVKSLHAQHYSLPELLYPSPITHTSSSREVAQVDSDVKNTNYSKEDDIATMMDGLEIDSENDSYVQVQTKRKIVTNADEQSATVQKISPTDTSKLTANTKDKTGRSIKVDSEANEDDLVKKVSTITKEHLATLAPVINDLLNDLIPKKQKQIETQPVSGTSVETLRELLQKFQSPKDSDTKAPITDENREGRPYKSKKGLTSETEKRDENVQLICVSSTERVSRMTRCDASCQSEYRIGSKAPNSKNLADPNVNHTTNLIVSKQVELLFLAYRSEYRKLCRSKPMYSSSTQNKPWDIVAWVSDKLIEELIIEITEELQMDDIIEKMFKMEFREF